MRTCSTWLLAYHAIRVEWFILLRNPGFLPFAEKLQARGIGVFFAGRAALTPQQMNGTGVHVAQHDFGFAEPNALIVLTIFVIANRKPGTTRAGVVDCFCDPGLRRAGGRASVVATLRPLVLGTGLARARSGFAGLANTLITAIEKRATVIGDDRFPAVHIVARGIAAGTSRSTNRE
jgi:hypothetical protein